MNEKLNKGKTMILSEIFSQTIGILRFVAAPFASFLIVWLFSADRALLLTKFNSAYPASIGAIIIFGVIIYYGHRIIIHPIIHNLMLWYVNKKTGKQFDSENLQFDRWKRRGSENAEIKAVQSGIDEASAASHFFYCVSLNSTAIVFSLKMFPELLNKNTLLENGIWFWMLVFCFFGLGLLQDWRTSRWDRRLFTESTKSK